MSKVITFVLVGLLFSFAKANVIDTTTEIRIGGIQQFVSIQGKDDGNPLILYLHGGPGAAVSAHSDEVSKELENDFVVVHWDQRGSGKTAQINESSKPPSLSLMKSDAEEMLNYVLNEFKREQVIVLGNSWGTILGFYLVQKHPDKVAAFIAVSPIVDLKRSQNLTLEELKSHFIENEEAINQLSKVKVPFEDAEQMLILHRWESIYNGIDFPAEQFQQYLVFFENWSHQWMPIYQELYAINLQTQVSEISTPILFLIGDRDLTTHYHITASYFESLVSPEKKLVWMEGVGHNIPGSAARKMQEIIINNTKSLLPKLE